MEDTIEDMTKMEGNMLSSSSRLSKPIWIKPLICTMVFMSYILWINQLALGQETECAESGGYYIYPCGLDQYATSEGSSDYSIQFDKLPEISGDVRILFQTSGVDANDRIEVLVNGSTFTNNTYTPPTTISGYSGPYKNNTQGCPEAGGACSGAHSFVVPENASNHWANYDGTDNFDIVLATNARPNRIQIKKTDSDGTNRHFRIRNLLVQPSRIGMRSSKLGCGIYAFAGLKMNEAHDDVTFGSYNFLTVSAMNSTRIQGLSVWLWWEDVQPVEPSSEGDSFNPNLKNDAQGHGLNGVCSAAYNNSPRKPVHLYLRGINEYDTSTHRSCPEWVYNKWINDLGNEAITLTTDTDRIWLRTTNISHLLDLRDLVTSNDSTKWSLYRSMYNYLQNSGDVIMNSIDAISFPSLSCGVDPGQFSWRRMSQNKFDELLLDEGYTVYQATNYINDIVVGQWRPRYIAPFESMNDNRLRDFGKRYTVMSSTYLDDQWRGFPLYRDNWYPMEHAKLFFNQSWPSTLGLGETDRKVFACFNIDNGDWEEINEALTQDYSNLDETPELIFWNLRAASQEGAITWGQASVTFFPIDASSNDYEYDGLGGTGRRRLCDGVFNAFLLGVRGFELYGEQFAAIPIGEREYLDNYINMFKIRNALSINCNMYNFQDVPVIR